MTVETARVVLNTVGAIGLSVVIIAACVVFVVGAWLAIKGACKRERW
jgi:hypothetical protein